MSGVSPRRKRKFYRKQRPIHATMPMMKMYPKYLEADRFARKRPRRRMRLLMPRVRERLPRIREKRRAAGFSRVL
jgi:hypothetical protein